MIALGDMQDDSALPALREMFEESVYKIGLARVVQDGDLAWAEFEKIRRISEIMFRAGGKAARFVKKWRHYEYDQWMRKNMTAAESYSYI